MRRLSLVIACLVAGCAGSSTAPSVVATVDEPLGTVKTIGASEAFAALLSTTPPRGTAVDSQTLFSLRVRIGATGQLADSLQTDATPLPNGRVPPPPGAPVLVFRPDFDDDMTPDAQPRYLGNTFSVCDGCPIGESAQRDSGRFEYIATLANIDGVFVFLPPLPPPRYLVVWAALSEIVCMADDVCAAAPVTVSDAIGSVAFELNYQPS